MKKHGIVYRETKSTFAYAGWPTVAKGNDGRIYAVCSGHRLGHICPFGKNYMFTSCDGGESWSMPTVINDTYLDDRDAGLLITKSGRMIMSYFCHSRDFYITRCDEFLKHFFSFPEARGLYLGAVEYLKSMPESKNTFGSFIRISDNGGKSWSDAVNIPVSSPHGPIELRDGRILYLGKHFRSMHDQNMRAYDGIEAFESRDGGESWEKIAEVSMPDGCTGKNVHEPYAIELPDGTLVGAIRAQGDEVEYGFTIYMTYSYDGGRSWTKPQPTGICGSPPHLLLHSSGALIMTYGRREKPYGERAVISYDGGKSFGEEIILFDHAPSSDLGYPSSVELDDGSILTIYYQRYDADNHASILSTKWRIDDER